MDIKLLDLEKKAGFSRPKSLDLMRKLGIQKKVIDRCNYISEEDADRMMRMSVLPNDLIPKTYCAYVWRKAKNPRWVLATIVEDKTVKPVLIPFKVKADRLLKKTIKVEKIEDGNGETYRML